MTERLQRQWFRQLSRKSLGWRLFCLGLFAWVTVYNPVHLLLEQHWDPHDEPAVARSGLSGDESHSGHGSHKIHSSSDHKLRATSQTQAVPEAFPITGPAVALPEAPPPRFVVLFLVERVNPPGMDFPAPLLARAPPVS